MSAPRITGARRHAGCDLGGDAPDRQQRQMIVFIAGATGAVGRPLVEQLVAAGHDVVGTTRSPEKLGQLRAAGAAGIVLDAFDDDALRRAIVGASPDVVIDELTDLSQPPRPRCLTFRAAIKRQNKTTPDI